MGCIVPRVAILLSLLVTLQTASAAIAAESVQEPDTQNVQYCHRMSRRAYRHRGESVRVAQRETPPHVPPKTAAHAATKADTPPAQILIEATIIEVTLKKDFRSGVKFAQLDGSENRSQFGEDAVMNAKSGFRPASIVTTAHRMTPEEAIEIKFVGVIRDNTSQFLRRLESMGEAKVLAAPRLLILDKQLADVQLGNQLAYENTSLDGTTMTIEYILIGTELRARPSGTDGGMIRLEGYLKRTTGKLDSIGIPQTESYWLPISVIALDGSTIAIGREPYAEIGYRPDARKFLRWIPYVSCLLPEPEDYIARHKQLSTRQTINYRIREQSQRFFWRNGGHIR
jgi:hypothetical protein